MLGRQQIAGIPTAVSEIFKNAYDAYAKKVRGDFYQSQNALTIRDDGVGMSQEDFLTRWLTVGTESKLTASSLGAVNRPAHMPERRQMGEKGIGRLAIATVGPQLIVITRGRDSNGESLDSLVVALVQWSMFEIPGITLDNVVVPTREISSESELGPALLEELRTEVTASLDALGDKVSTPHADRIRGELEQLNFDIAPYLRVAGPNVLEASGTAFIVCPVSPDVPAAMKILDAKPDDFSVSDFQRFLLGFTNSIAPSDRPLDFRTEFYSHSDSGAADLIDPSTYFWDDSDFSMTDHTVEGEFDDRGSFSGKLQIYGEEPIDFVQSWDAGSKRRSGCGPFKIKFGYVQGKASESSLEATDFATMTARLEKIGGLYVYRDGIRVLPYGNSDWDYLEIEKRRTLNAARYYFSYRRMFGAIDLDSRRTGGLQEKAGREGFRENGAYRDFRDILKNFLQQLAATYFSSQGDAAAEWRFRRQELSDETKKRNEAHKQRTAFSRQLGVAIESIENGGFAASVSRVVKNAREEVRKANLGSVIADARHAELNASQDLQKLASRIAIAKPAGLALTTELDREWNSYLKLEAFAKEELSRASLEIDEVLAGLSGDVSPAASAAATLQNRRIRLEQRAAAYRQSQNELSYSLRDNVSASMKTVADATDRELQQFDTEISDLLTNKDPGGLADELALLDRMEEIAEHHAERLTRLQKYAADIESNADLASRVVLLEEQILDLEEQIDINLELLQLGQAVQIVSHEFESSIRSVRAGLRQLEPWAKSTPRLQPIVRDIGTSFSHLDGYLRLFTPLQRRLYNEAALISGSEIEGFLRGVFAERMARHAIRLEKSVRFSEYAFRAYPSTFYPVFVNLVDNAIHWLSESDGPRIIALDADMQTRSLSVSDTGPGVRPRDAAYVFERGFSRRRGGRGLGLALARELLERDSWTLELKPSSKGATFELRPVEEEDPV
jgi:signal transduction histidine kinase